MNPLYIQDVRTAIKNIHDFDTSSLHPEYVEAIQNLADESELLCEEAEEASDTIEKLKDQIYLLKTALEE